MHTYQVGGPNTAVEVYEPRDVQEYIDEDGQFMPHEHALVIGNHGDSAFAIIGSIPEIRQWLIGALATVNDFQPVIGGELAGAALPAAGAQTFRIEVRFDHHGTEESARAAGQTAASSLGGEVTAIFDEGFEEL